MRKVWRVEMKVRNEEWWVKKGEQLMNGGREVLVDE